MSGARRGATVGGSAVAVLMRNCAAGHGQERESSACCSTRERGQGTFVLMSGCDSERVSVKNRKCFSLLCVAVTDIRFTGMHALWMRSRLHTSPAK